VYEFPKAEGDPYYPVPRPENAELYKKYQLLAAELKDVFFVGRLATYKYYNMDQVVAQALTLFRKIQTHVQNDATFVNGQETHYNGKKTTVIRSAGDLGRS
jgi:UDP-galactopyranose mutase